MDFCKEIWKKVLEFLEHTTSHGLPRIVESEHIYKKFFWAVCFIFSLCICLFMVAKSVDGYLDYDVTTSIRIVPEDSIVFPEVSICNNNPYAYKRALAEGTLYDYYNFDFLMLNCSFLYQSCDESFYEIRNDTNFGRCYYFNANTRSAVAREGDGLYLIFFVGPTFDNVNITNLIENVTQTQMPTTTPCPSSLSETPLPSTTTTTTTSTSTDIPRKVIKDGRQNLTARGNFLNYDYSGIVIVIDDQSQFPLSKEGIVVSGGNLARISLTKTNSQSMPMPYSSCTDNSQIDTLLSKELNRLNRTYTRVNCLILCEQKIIYDQIGCYDPSFPPILDQTNPCNTIQEIHELFHITYNLDECGNYCPFECQSIEFDSSLSYALFPSIPYYQELLLNDKEHFFARALYVNSEDEISYQMLSASVLSLYIYYDRIATTQILEAPSMSIYDLIANIGGTLGLFIGVSLLSFVELFELIFNVVLVLVQNTIFRKGSRQSEKAEDTMKL